MSNTIVNITLAIEYAVTLTGMTSGEKVFVFLLYSIIVFTWIYIVCHGDRVRIKIISNTYVIHILF